MFKNVFIMLLWLAFQHATPIAVASHPRDSKSGFVFINDLDPSIIIDLRYYSDNNITGKPIINSQEQKAVLSREAATALSFVQEELAMHGYSLVIYDAYHSFKTYKQLEKWAHNAEENSQKDNYYPYLSKQELIQKKYIQNKRDHTRGSTVDVSIIPLKQKIKTPYTTQKRSYKNHKDILYIDDGTVEMGSSYDLQDEISSHKCQTIYNNAKNNRQLLKDIMTSHGFMANDKVWWQYTLIREPYPDTEFDFDV